MSSDRIKREIIPLLEANGFRLIRENKHPIYSDGISTFPIPKGTRSDRRCKDFFRLQIRKKCRLAGREFIDIREQHKPREKEVSQFTNTPRVETGGKTILIRPDVEQPKKEVPTKTLDKAALDFCIMAKQDAGSKDEWSKAYTKWVTEHQRVRELISQSFQDS